MQNKNKLQIAKNNLTFAVLLAFIGISIVVIVAIFALRPQEIAEINDNPVPTPVATSTPTPIPVNNSGPIRANNGPSEIIPYDHGYLSIDSSYTIDMDNENRTAKYTKSMGPDNTEELFLTFDKNPAGEGLQRFAQHYFRPRADNAFNTYQRKYLLFNAITGTLVYEEINQVVTLTIIEYGRNFYILSVRNNLLDRTIEQAQKENESRMEEVLDRLRLPEGDPNLRSDFAVQ